MPKINVFKITNLSKLKDIGRKSTIIFLGHCILMSMSLSHPLLRTQNMKMKEHEDLGWKKRDPMTEEEE